MAVLQMKRINICALKKDRKPVLELLQRRGAVEVDSVLPEDSVFSRTDTSANRSVFQKKHHRCRVCAGDFGPIRAGEKIHVRLVRGA